MYEREKELYERAVPAFIVTDIDGTDVTDAVTGPKRKRDSAANGLHKAVVSIHPLRFAFIPRDPSSTNHSLPKCNSAPSSREGQRDRKA